MTHTSLESLLEDARRRVEVAPSELAEAKRRRDAIAAALKSEFQGRIYVNGSVAHGDALTPLADVDLGVVVPDPTGAYGPGRRGPRELQDRAADAVRAHLRPAYGDLRVEVEGRKRSILVRFRDAVRPGLPDFTADIIVAVDNPAGSGLLIPKWGGWDCSHPEQHTRLVRAAIDSSQVRYARVVRLIKHWNRQLPESVLCSWHIKVLALDCLQQPGTLVAGLQSWFDHASDALRAPTPDPAHVGPDIKASTTPAQAARRARVAAALLREAADLEKAGFGILAHAKLAEIFNDADMLPSPSREDVVCEEAVRLQARSADDRTRTMVTGASSFARPATRSWAQA